MNLLKLILAIGIITTVFIFNSCTINGVSTENQSESLTTYFENVEGLETLPKNHIYKDSDSMYIMIRNIDSLNNINSTIKIYKDKNNSDYLTLTEKTTLKNELVTSQKLNLSGEKISKSMSVEKILYGEI